MEDMVFPVGGLLSVVGAFVAMLKLLARPDGRWAPLVERLESEITWLRAEVQELRTENALLRQRIEQEES